MGGWVAGRGWFRKRKDMGALCFFLKERDRRDKERIFLPRETARTQHPDLIYKLLLMANKCCGCVFAKMKRELYGSSQHLPQNQKQVIMLLQPKHTHTDIVLTDSNRTLHKHAHVK